MAFRPRRTDRLSPEEREIVDRFERGAIDAAEAGRLLIDSVNSADPHAPASNESERETAETVETVETEPAPLDETPEEARARALVERIAQDVYDDPA